MRILFCNDARGDPDLHLQEIVERKGIGHPDTLADLAAETFSNIYSQFGLSQFGAVPNHWVDKVVLAGGTADLSFGASRITRPITAYLFGKVTEKVGSDVIPVQKLWRSAILHVFRSIFGDHGQKAQINFEVDTNTGVGLDHDNTFYHPLAKQLLPGIDDDLLANDTVYCHAVAGWSVLEQLIINLENYINSPQFKTQFPETGWDVKLLGVRTDREISLTICIPFIASSVASANTYRTLKGRIIDHLLSHPNLSDIRAAGYKVVLLINTKDTDNSFFLTSFGTALDKGDYGAVGRANRCNGVMSANRVSSFEAIHGKNPLHHAGKIYTILAHNMAILLHQKYAAHVGATITTSNGRPIRDPELIHFTFANGDEHDHNVLTDVVNLHLAAIPALSRRIINSDVLARHRSPTLPV